MQQKSTKPIDKKKLIASIAIVSAMAATGYELNRLSANPVSEKHCPLVFVDAAISSNTQISVDIKPLSQGELLKWKQKAGRSTMSVVWTERRCMGSWK